MADKSNDVRVDVVPVVEDEFSRCPRCHELWNGEECGVCEWTPPTPSTRGRRDMTRDMQREWRTIEVCEDCYFAHHYGAHEVDGKWYVAESDVPADCRPLSLLSDEDDVFDGTDSETGEGIHEFSWAPCEGCGSNLGGARFTLTVARDLDDDEVRHYVITIPVGVAAETDDEAEVAIDELIGDLTAQASEPPKHSGLSWWIDDPGITIKERS